MISMLPSKINLLPPDKKELIKKLVKFIFFKEMLEITLLVTSFLSIVLLWSWFFIQNQYNDLTQSALLINNKYSNYNQEIKKINTAIKQFDSANKNFSPLTPKILELVEKLPSDIKINSLSIDRQKNTLSISGVAKTREALLSYQTLLKNYYWLESIQTPTSQLFQKENVNFEIKATTKNLTIPKETP